MPLNVDRGDGREERRRPMARPSSPAGVNGGVGACTPEPLQGATQENPFAALTDAQRRNIRAIIAEAGCLRCPFLVVVRGRNCNSYGCRQRTGCESLTRTLALYKLVVEGLTGG